MYDNWSSCQPEHHDTHHPWNLTSKRVWEIAWGVGVFWRRPARGPTCVCSCIPPSRLHLHSGTGGKLNSGLLWCLDRCCSGVQGRMSLCLFPGCNFLIHEINEVPVLFLKMPSSPFSIHFPCLWAKGTVMLCSWKKEKDWIVFNILMLSELDFCSFKTSRPNFKITDVCRDVVKWILQAFTLLPIFMLLTLHL